jgi:hypothetical protein
LNRRSAERRRRANRESRALEEDWKGLDAKRLFRAMRLLAEQAEAVGGPGAPIWSIDHARLEESWAEVRAAAAAMRPRTSRPIWRLATPDDGGRPLDERLSALASEVGASPYGRHLTVDELMAEFSGAEAEGIAIVRRLLELGFCRRPYPALGATHRYYSRGPEERAEVRRQLIAWLSDGHDR